MRLQYQFFLAIQTNCKHFYSFLGPYINSRGDPGDDAGYCTGRLCSTRWRLHGRVFPAAGYEGGEERAEQEGLEGDESWRGGVGVVGKEREAEQER